MSPKGLRVEFRVPRPHKHREEALPAPAKDPVPRISRLLALAHKWEGMVRRGEVKDYAEIARRMGLSRARVTQVCRLVLLRPEDQEEILTLSARDSHPSENRCQALVHCSDWEHQRRI